MFKEMSKTFHYLKLHLNHKAKRLKTDRIIELKLRKHKIKPLEPRSQKKKLFSGVPARLDTNKAIDIDKRAVIYCLASEQ